MSKFYNDKKIIIILIVILLIISGAFLFYKENLKRKVSKAEREFFNCEYDNAIKLYEKLGSKNKKSAYWDAKISEAYLMKKDKSNCEKYMDIALEKQDKDGEGHSIILNNKIILMKENLGSNRFSKEQLISLEKEGQEYLNKYPNNKEIKKMMFLIYMLNNNLEKSENIVENYCTVNDDSFILCEKARMEFILGKSKEGIETLKNAYDKNPGDFKIYDTIFNSYEEDKSVLDNIITLQKENKDNLYYKLSLVRIYLGNNEVAKSEEILNSLDENTKNNSIVYKVFKIYLLEAKNDTENANREINDLLKKEPKDYIVNYIAGWYCFRNNELDKALQYGKDSIKENPTYIESYVNLIPEILKVKGNGNLAQPYYHYALYKEPYNTAIYINKGIYSWYNMNNSVEAIGNFRIAQMLKPKDMELSYQTSLIYLANHNYNEAIDILKKIVSIDKDNVIYHRTLGTAYFVAKNYNDSYDQFEIAYELDKKDILTLNNLGCYYIMVDGDIDKGFKYIVTAYKNLNDNYDEYTKNTITENYNKIEQLKNKYNEGKNNQVLEIPDFIMFY